MTHLIVLTKMNPTNLLKLIKALFTARDLVCGVCKRIFFNHKTITVSFKASRNILFNYHQRPRWLIWPQVARYASTEPIKDTLLNKTIKKSASKSLLILMTTGSAKALLLRTLIPTSNDHRCNLVLHLGQTRGVEIS